MLNNRYTQAIIEKIFPNGYWYREPIDSNWYTETVVISRGQVQMEPDKKKLFIAIDSDTWHIGSKNTGIYSGWNDTHALIPRIARQIDGVIAQRPIESLDDSIPQYIITDTYKCLKDLADYSYQVFQGKMIAVTGTAGKSTSKYLMSHVLENHFSLEVTRGNHNTRTGVPLTIACAITNPDYLIVESAISGLWMKPHGILKSYPPDVALITSIDGGQQKTAYETAILKAKIAEGMNHQGIVVINKDINEYETLLKNVKKYNDKVITYGFHDNADSVITAYEEIKGKTKITANILGEEVKFQTTLIGNAMIANIIGVLTVLKTQDIPLKLVLPFVETYKTKEGVQRFEAITKRDGEQFTLLDDSWNATGIAMIEAIRLFDRQSKFFQGRKIAILGRIENLGKEEAKRQHEALIEPIMQSNIELVFAHGPEMKYVLKGLPETLIGGYFEDSKSLAREVAPLIDDNAFVLLKGSPRSSDFKHVKQHVIEEVQQNRQPKKTLHKHPHATGSGALTFDIETNEIVGMSGNVRAEQNQGLGNVLLINHIIEGIFTKQYELTDLFKPGKQALKENKSLNAVALKENEAVSLYTILMAAIVHQSPNALLMLANQVIGNNKQALKAIQDKGQKLGIEKEMIQNLTGRRISNRKQRLTLHALYIVGKVLFDKYPQQLALLSQSFVQHNGEIYQTKTNLFNNGTISHGLFYGYKNAIGIVLTQIDAKKYITVVLGANDAYERDHLITDSLNKMMERKETEIKPIYFNKDTNYTMNIMGDTYFGEFYTEIRKRRGIKDALQLYNRSYSFDKLRPMLLKGDYNICNFEAAISNESSHRLKAQKPFVLHADAKHTVLAIKQEKFDLVTLANNHLLDCGVTSLELTLSQLKEMGIDYIGAGLNESEAEKPLVKIVNGKRITIFNAYWYRNPMYLAYDFYAIGNNPGVACLSGGIQEKITTEKSNYPDGFIVVIPHWGADFQRVSLKQREYAHSLMEAGADLIIGHGAHMIQEIEKVADNHIVYSIGNGVFNSNGEYNRRHVAPYSLIAQLRLSETWSLRLYPIYSNNLKTFWQPDFVNSEQFNHCTLSLQSYGSTSLQSQQDEEGRFYYQIDL